MRTVTFVPLSKTGALQYIVQSLPYLALLQQRQRIYLLFEEQHSSKLYAKFSYLTEDTFFVNYKYQAINVVLGNNRYLLRDPYKKVSIFGGVTIGHCNKKNSYEHVSISESLSR
jgi:hypothetical protein